MLNPAIRCARTAELDHLQRDVGGGDNCAAAGGG
jgi:hypothetical protein